MSWLDRARQFPVAPVLTLPARFAEAKFSDLPAGELKVCTEEYLARFADVAIQGIGCLFLGRARRYKTYATAVIVRSVNHYLHVDAEFVQCPILVGILDRERFAPTTATLVERIKSADLVVMDDFAQVPAQTVAATTMMEIAEHRFANLRPTLWTGNVDGDNVLNVLADRYSPGFARRVHDASEGFRVRVQ